MRLFVALDLPPEARTQIATCRAPDVLDARWTAPAQYHVTLRFIGDARPNAAARYEEALAGVTAPAADCTPYGLDVLPSRRSPRVLVVGLNRTDSLMTTYQAVSDALESAGLSPEDRPYRPHVTLARLDDLSPRTVHAFLKDRDGPTEASFQVPQFHLYESTRTHEGAHHEQRASFALAPQ